MQLAVIFLAQVFGFILWWGAIEFLFQAVPFFYIMVGGK